MVATVTFRLDQDQNRAIKRTNIPPRQPQIGNNFSLVTTDCWLLYFIYRHSGITRPLGPDEV